MIKKAVILLNMGGPSNLFEVETFLKNMFNDPHILQVKSTFMRKIIGMIIVNKRIDEAKKNYQAIGGKSPITATTFTLTQKLNTLDPDTYYTYAMRYTPPYADMVVMDLIHRGIEQVVLFSMYPQYSTTTIQSSLEDFKDACKKHHYQPTISIIQSYPTHPEYISLIASQIHKSMQEKNPQNYSLILSAHGLPQSVIDRGDPYEKHCKESQKALEAKLLEKGIRFKEILLSYQSKLGPMKWLEPSTKQIIKDKKNIVIYPIAFSIDNSETLFELDIELKALAQKSGVQDFIRIPCLNDSEGFAQMIINLTQGEKNA
ncbi:ferrochelatase [Helicobacter cholecystus]|nr:ferrochelatase [Helicobacter cholecystus]